MTTVLSSPDASQATSLSPAQIAKTWKAAQDFEAMALAELLQPIFNTVSTSGSVFGGGEGEQAFKPMLVQEIAKQIAGNNGIGLAQPVFEQMLKAQEARMSEAPG